MIKPPWKITMFAFAIAYGVFTFIVDSKEASLAAATFSQIWFAALAVTFALKKEIQTHRSHTTRTTAE